MEQDPTPRPSSKRDATASQTIGTAQPDDGRRTEAPRSDDASRATDAAQKEQDRQIEDGTETPG